MSTNGIDSFESPGDDPFDVVVQSRGASSPARLVEDPIAYEPPQARRPMTEVLRDANRTGARVSDFLEDVASSSAIGAETLIDGNVRVVRGKSVIIRGTVNGSVECEGFVLLLPEGRIHGTVRAGHLWVEGEIAPCDGSAIKVEAGILHLGPGGHIKAHVTYDHLSMADGNRGIQGGMTLRQHDGLE